MTHRLEMNEDGTETLILVYPPAAIRHLAETLAAAERLHGPLPDLMQVPVRGVYTATTPARDSSERASVGTRGLSA